MPVTCDVTPQHSFPPRITFESHSAGICPGHVAHVHYAAGLHVRLPLEHLERQDGPRSRRQRFRPWVMQVAGRGTLADSVMRGSSKGNQIAGPHGLGTIEGVASCEV
ncbi:hypothetical protein MRX96_048415 [Rhipicephalus microplus]